MKDKTRNLLTGAGSILDIMPPRRRVDFSRLLPKETQTQRMANAWNQAGNSIRIAIREFEHEACQKKT